MSLLFSVVYAQCPYYIGFYAHSFLIISRSRSLSRTHITGPDRTIVQNDISGKMDRRCNLTPVSTRVTGRMKPLWVVFRPVHPHELGAVGILQLIRPASHAPITTVSSSADLALSVKIVFRVYLATFRKVNCHSDRAADLHVWR